MTDKNDGTHDRKQPSHTDIVPSGVGKGGESLPSDNGKAGDSQVSRNRPQSDRQIPRILNEDHNNKDVPEDTAAKSASSGNEKAAKRVSSIHLRPDTRPPSDRRTGNDRRRTARRTGRRSDRKSGLLANISEEYSELSDRNRFFGLTAKFCVPICFIILAALVLWGLWVDNIFKWRIENEICKRGLEIVNTMTPLGRQMLRSRQHNPGSWALRLGYVTRQEVVKAFGDDLEKRVLVAGFDSVAEALSALDGSAESKRILTRHGLAEGYQLAEVLGADSVVEAEAELKKLPQRYQRFFGLDPAENGGSWSGMADAPLEVFDSYQLVERMNRLVREKGILAELITISASDGSFAKNEVLNAYVSDEKRIIVASSFQAYADYESRFVPGDKRFRGVDINSKHFIPADIIVQWGQFYSFVHGGEVPVEIQDSLNFSRSIMDSEGNILGNVVLSISAQRISEEHSTMRWVMAGIGLVAMGVVAIFSVVVSNRIASPIKRLIKDMDIVARGDMTHRTDASSDDEVGDLAKQFNLMTKHLQAAHQSEIETQHIEDELERAREIQIGLLPSKIPAIKGFDVFASYHPAREVGGDYYDFFPIDKEHVGVIVADVSGKGIPGSMVMGTTRTILRFAAAGNTSAADTLSRTNQVVAADIRRGMFVTAFYVVLDARKREMLCASAGHNPMAIYRSNGAKIEWINPNGIALGFDKGPLFGRTIKEESVTLYPGDRAVLYTDGIIEAMNEAKEEYGADRFGEFICSHAALGSEDFVAELLNDIDKHSGDCEQNDDITIVTIKVL